MLTVDRPRVMKSRLPGDLAPLAQDRDQNGNIRISKKVDDAPGISITTQSVDNTRDRNLGGGDRNQGVNDFSGSLAAARGRNLGELREAARQEGGKEASGERKKLRRRSSSFVALKNAFSALYSGDDFWRERIASGFFSVVYKVTHRTTGEVLVMKMSQQTNTRANNLHEIELLNRLHHPNILRLKGVCIEEGQLHALTEYVNGGNLQELICDDREYLSWPDRLKLSSDIADGMKYLHSKGFMHRDLSSQNILVRRKHLDFECVIADLGLAIRKPKSESVVLPVVGTPYWISPECLHGKFYGPESDVFSFGIVMCEIIARVSADPEELPRTMDFGLNEAAFTLLAGDCPNDMLNVAIQCCKICPKERPPFQSIVNTLAEMRHSHVTNISRSLTCTDTGSVVTEVPTRARSRTISKELLPHRLPKKYSRSRTPLVRCNSDCGLRDLNFTRVSQRLNPFLDPRPEASWGEDSREGEASMQEKSVKDLKSPVTRLCEELALVWPRGEADLHLTMVDDRGDRNRFASLPCMVNDDDTGNMISLRGHLAVSSRGEGSGCVTDSNSDTGALRDSTSQVERGNVSQDLPRV